MFPDFTMLWRRKTLWFFLFLAVLGLCCCVGFSLVVASGAFSLAVVHRLLIAVASLVAQGFPGGSDGKESACNAGDWGSIPGSGRSPGERQGNPTPVFLPGESPWREEPGLLPSMGSQRVGYD